MRFIPRLGLIAMLVQSFASFAFGSSADLLIETNNVTATYTVPSPLELSAVATFDVKASLESDDESMNIKYIFPPALVGGKEMLVALQGLKNARFIEVADTALGITGQCLESSDGVTCMLDYSQVYNKLNIDQDSVRDFMKQEFKMDPNLDKILEIGKIFSEDPIGVLSIHFAKSDHKLSDQITNRSPQRTDR